MWWTMNLRWALNQREIGEEVDTYADIGEVYSMISVSTHRV